MKLKFQFEIYQRRFKQPLRTSHGIWQVRKGIIISLNDRINTARGEIAPLSWFGSETFSQALKFCQQLSKTITKEEIAKIPDSLPCCQFAFESALMSLHRSPSSNTEDNLKYCYLLPAGDRALTSWQTIDRKYHNSTFKWKIGVYPLKEEISLLKRLVEVLPATVKLRLDANGGLSLAEAKELLTVTDNLNQIEFVEQPISSDSFTQILQLRQNYTTPLALDESVASFKQLQYAHQQGWQGIFVIKASIMGFPSRLLEYCQNRSLDVVFSSVFETEVGRHAVLQLARQLHHPRPLGFGIDYFLE